MKAVGIHRGPGKEAMMGIAGPSGARTKPGLGCPPRRHGRNFVVCQFVPWAAALGNGPHGPLVLPLDLNPEPMLVARAAKPPAEASKSDGGTVLEIGFWSGVRMAAPCPFRGPKPSFGTSYTISRLLASRSVYLPPPKRSLKPKPLPRVFAPGRGRLNGCLEFKPSCPNPPNDGQKKPYESPVNSFYRPPPHGADDRDDP